MSSPNRMYFLDNLRAFVVLLVIVLHGAMTYMANAPTWWYVVDPQNSLFFTALVLLIDVPIMQAMFFIAGYFAMPSLQKRGVKAFLRDKSLRIGLPWVFGALLLAPPTTYLIYYSRQSPMSLWQFWQTDFWGPLYQQSVYWYLGILLSLFALLALVYSSSLKNAAPTTVHPPNRWSWIFGALMTASFVLINLSFPMDSWKSLSYLFVFQPLRLPLYAGYFALGIYAQQHGWLTDEGYLPRLDTWGTICIISGGLYLGLRLFVGASPFAQFVIDILFNVFCLSSLLAGLAFFKTRVNADTPFWRSLSASSYGMYYFHPLILYPLTLFLVPIALPLAIKAPAVILLGMSLSWAFSAFVVKRIPLARDIF